MAYIIFNEANWQLIISVRKKICCNRKEKTRHQTADANTVFEDCNLGMTMITPSAQNVVGFLISRNSVTWFLDFNLTFKILWTLRDRCLLVLMLESRSLSHVIDQYVKELIHVFWLFLLSQTNEKAKHVDKMLFCHFCLSLPHQSICRVP